MMTSTSTNNKEVSNNKSYFDFLEKWLSIFFILFHSIQDGSLDFIYSSPVSLRHYILSFITNIQRSFHRTFLTVKTHMIHSLTFKFLHEMRSNRTTKSSHDTGRASTGRTNSFFTTLGPVLRWSWLLLSALRFRHLAG